MFKLFGKLQASGIGKELPSYLNSPSGQSEDTLLDWLHYKTG